MDRKKLTDITTDHYKNLRKYMRRIFPVASSETIHEFRVEYKKLRAFLRMLSQQPSVKNQINLSKKLKKVYSISGTLRDFQLQQVRIADRTQKDPKKPQAYLHLLQKEIEKLKPELFETISGKPVTESKKKTDEMIPSDFSYSDFSRFAQKKRDAVRAIIASGNFSDDNIHAIRKILKDLSYNNKIFLHEDTKIETADTLPVDSLLEELGNFQDKCTSIALLKSYWIIQLNTYNQELLNRLKKTWIREKVNSKQLLIKKLRTILIAGKI